MRAYSIPAQLGVSNSCRRYTTGGAAQSRPGVADGVVYVGSDDNNLYSLNASTYIFAFTWGPHDQPR